MLTKEESERITEVLQREPTIAEVAMIDVLWSEL